MNHIEIICFGGAESMHKSPDFPFARCVNYYSINDPLLFVVNRAARALRSGFYMGGGQYTNYGGYTTSSSSLAALAQQQHDDDEDDEPEFVFLTPRAGDPIIDHGLLGPTYIDALQWEGRRYQRLYIPFWVPWVDIAYARMVVLGESFSTALTKAFKIVLQKTLIPFIMGVMTMNLWLKEHILVPLMMFFVMLWEKIRLLIAIYRGDDKYEQITLVQSNKGEKVLQGIEES